MLCSQDFKKIFKHNQHKLGFRFYAMEQIHPTWRKYIIHKKYRQLQ